MLNGNEDEDVVAARRPAIDRVPWVVNKVPSWVDGVGGAACGFDYGEVPTFCTWHDVHLTGQGASAILY